MNSISGLWLPWGLPYLDATLDACPTQGLKESDNGITDLHERPTQRFVMFSLTWY